MTTIPFSLKPSPTIDDMIVELEYLLGGQELALKLSKYLPIDNSLFGGVLPTNNLSGFLNRLVDLRKLHVELYKVLKEALPTDFPNYPDEFYPILDAALDHMGLPPFNPKP